MFFAKKRAPDVGYVEVYHVCDVEEVKIAAKGLRGTPEGVNNVETRTSFTGVVLSRMPNDVKVGEDRCVKVIRIVMFNS